jgi:nitrate/TMAO reductase-like tetraheme cytochrome c subunit
MILGANNIHVWEPKKFVGSETCKSCHLEHYDSWKMTLHSRMLISTKKNPMPSWRN